MDILREQPLVILVLGSLLAALLLAALVKTGRRELLYALIGAVVLTGGLLAIERRIVTEREQVRSVLFQIAADLERNDVSAVLGHISPEADQVRFDAETALKYIRIREAKIKRNLEIEVRSDQNPPLAVASFNGLILGGDRFGQADNQRYAAYFVVTFRKEGNEWKVRAYERHDPREGL